MVLYCTVLYCTVLYFSGSDVIISTECKPNVSVSPSSEDLHNMSLTWLLLQTTPALSTKQTQTEFSLCFPKFWECFENYNMTATTSTQSEPSAVTSRALQRAFWWFMAGRVWRDGTSFPLPASLQPDSLPSLVRSNNRALVESPLVGGFSQGLQSTSDIRYKLEDCMLLLLSQILQRICIVMWEYSSEYIPISKCWDQSNLVW